MEQLPSSAEPRQTEPRPSPEARPTALSLQRAINANVTALLSQYAEYPVRRQLQVFKDRAAKAIHMAAQNSHAYAGLPDKATPQTPITQLEFGLAQVKIDEAERQLRSAITFQRSKTVFLS